jgi:DNA-binding LytR/AlgR family response regulator
MELQVEPSELAAAATTPQAARKFLRWINAARGESVQLIGIEHVSYFRSDTKYTKVVALGREWLIRKTIKQLVAELDPAMFLQTHRATIVNLAAVESVGRDERGHVVLKMRDRSESLAVSQPYTHLFRQM